MATLPGIHALENVANQYLTEADFGVVEIETVMLKVFCDNPNGTEVLAWAEFWMRLNIYKEKVSVGEDAGKAHKVSPPLMILYCAWH
jgi:hypothetical protein